MEELEVLKLKNQALLERISQLTAQYEDQAANYRVEITGLVRQRDALQVQVQNWENSVQEEAKAAKPLDDAEA